MGNWGYESDVVPAPQPGVTQIRELAMTSLREQPQGHPQRISFQTPKDYTDGYSTFEIPATGNSVNRTIYLTHCHAVLRITVHWEDGYYPAEEQEDIHSACGACLANTAFRQVTTYRWPVVTELSHFPPIGSPVIWHQAKAAMNYNDELTGELVTYRLTSGSHPLLSITGVMSGL